MAALMSPRPARRPGPKGPPNPPPNPPGPRMPRPEGRRPCRFCGSPVMNQTLSCGSRRHLPADGTVNAVMRASFLEVISRYIVTHRLSSLTIVLADDADPGSRWLPLAGESNRRVPAHLVGRDCRRAARTRGRRRGAHIGHRRRRQPGAGLVPPVRGRADGAAAPLRQEVPVRCTGGDRPDCRRDQRGDDGKGDHRRLRRHPHAQPHGVALRPARPPFGRDGAGPHLRHRGRRGHAGERVHSWRGRFPVLPVHALLGRERVRDFPRGSCARGGAESPRPRGRPGERRAARRDRGAAADRAGASRRDRPLGVGDDRAGRCGASPPPSRAGARAAGPRDRRVDGPRGADRDAPARRPPPRAGHDAGVHPAAVAAHARHPDRDGARGGARGRPGDRGQGARAPTGRRPLRLSPRAGGPDQHPQVRRACPCVGDAAMARPRAGARGRKRRAQRRVVERLRARPGRHARARGAVRRYARDRAARRRRLRRPLPSPRGVPRMTVRVLIVDDQSLVRAGFRMILDAESEIEVVGEASDGLEAVLAARQMEPDVILMDVRMPNVDGLEATRRLLDGRDEGPRILILTTFDLDEYVYEALRAGASGFLLKDTPPEQLVEAIMIVARGDALLAPSITRRVIEEFVRRPPASTRKTPPELAELTTREREMLGYIAKGLSNAEIAQAAFVSETTVKTHVAHILMKLRLRDRVQAVVYAYENGVVEPGE